MTPQSAATPVIETPRLVLRRPGPSDLEGFLAYAGSDRARYIGGLIPRPAAWRAFAAILGHWQIRGFGLWAVCRRGEDRAIGLVGLLRPEGWPEGEIAWHVTDAAAEGKGIAFEAAAAARAEAFGPLGWPTAVSYIDPGNTRSIALAERLGAVRDPAAVAPGDQPCLVYRHPRNATA